MLALEVRVVDLRRPGRKTLIPTSRGPFKGFLLRVLGSFKGFLLKGSFWGL